MIPKFTGVTKNRRQRLYANHIMSMSMFKYVTINRPYLNKDCSFSLKYHYCHDICVLSLLAYFLP